MFIVVLVLHLNLAAQTKKETVDWINSKMPTNPIVYGEYFKSSQKMKINDDGSFEIINSDYELPIHIKNPKAETVTTLKGNFKDLTPTSVTVRIQKGLVFIDINCSNGKECIATSQTGKSGAIYDKKGITFGAFYASETNIAERLKKAFTRLIILCGGKKEAY